MKKLLFTFFLLLSGLNLNAQKNYAVHLDGKDNNLRIGMDTISRHWTLEAWIKPDGDEWRQQEVVIGGGEYSKLNTLDYLPLVIRNGVLYNTAARLEGGILPRQQWTHVAATCNGKSIVLYVDGTEVGRKDTVTVILPGAIGINESTESIFGGEVDEVRIWSTGLTGKELKTWMYRPLTARHPQFRHLKGYYTFDDLAEDLSVNKAAKGLLSFHIRNGRLKQYENAPLAYTVANDNPLFQTKEKPQELFQAVVIPTEWDVDQDSRDFQLLKLRIETEGAQKPLHLKELNLDFSGCTSLKDMNRIHIYYTGQSPRTKTRTELIPGGLTLEKKMRIKFPADVQLPLKPGTNYFLVTIDTNKEAVPGNRIKASVPSLKLNSHNIVPESPGGFRDISITLNSYNHPHILKVLQWNIWHGGNHLGKDGRERIIDLIRRTHADVITIQEGYGSQKMIADSLGYYLQTPSLKDNLALLSRYPLQKIGTQRTFFSNPAIVSLPEGQKVYVNDCWLRYAYRPEYTCSVANTGMNPDGWATEDSILGLQDIRQILENDLRPHIGQEIPAIIGGDFNSGSHLDWTPRAASLHYGYTAEKLPISRYLIENGFKDSFRELHPDEMERGEGTFAAIFGHSQTTRIDFLYYNGSKLRAISSKIVRTMPEIDDVWPSDHAAVLTTFELVE